ncbi:hypothetical protein ColTof4_13579 [Colletotrichum tofieldiae]|nr:hypothetical protein ColTof3_14528 [Colletotrichum tofieldiae]GKT81156.1 hypothetical protein ColTof4_13579 [Colletotrichum tofieldiae]GKT97333.1 hypothetical protein Ct61P_15183 [Colletotrichum tofieldiae]
MSDEYSFTRYIANVIEISYACTISSVGITINLRDSSAVVDVPNSEVSTISYVLDTEVNDIYTITKRPTFRSQR